MLYSQSARSTKINLEGIFIFKYSLTLAWRMNKKPAGDMRRKYTRSKSSSKYISKLCTQTTYAQRLKVEFLMFKYIAASSFPLVDNLHKNIQVLKIWYKIAIHICFHKIASIRCDIMFAIFNVILNYHLIGIRVTDSTTQLQRTYKNQTFMPLEFDASNTIYVSLESIPLSMPFDWSWPSTSARLTVRM